MTPNKTSFLKRVWLLMRPYWKSEERWMARLLLAVIVGLTLGGVYIDVQITKWYNDFYDALQNYDKPAFIHLIIRFSYLAAIAIAMGVYATYLNQMLRIKWRRWMTARYLNHWLDRQNYYRMQLFGNTSDNPDQRISVDIEQFIQLTLGLTLDGLNSVVTLFSFLYMLWVLSGALDFVVHGMAIHIPGYMVWVAFFYAFFGTWITFRIGRPLVKLNYEQQRYEADFRFSLVRQRENSESIAFYKGEEQEKAGYVTRFMAIFDNWWRIMKRQKKLNWFSSGYSQIAIIFPFVVAAPRYFAKEIQLGGLMQISSAFGKVQGSLSYLIDSYTTIANWKAVADRLSGFNDSVMHAEETQVPATLKRHVSAEKIIKARDLTIRLPDGRALLEHVNVTLKPGDSLLVTGVSGTGKSTLLRTLAGIWPFVEGSMEQPDHAHMLFVPQKPYLPLGTLRQALCYPAPPDLPDAQVREALSLCQIDYLAGRLDETDQWSHVLSLGEQQRVAFARILLNRPDFVFLDEATSAMDEPMEAHLYGVLAERLPDMARMSVGHRSSLRAWHKSQMVLDKKA